MDTLETPRLLLRAVRPDDWPAVQTMATQYMGSPMAAYDPPWPTDEDGVRAACGWFAGEEGWRAVCRRADGQLLGLVCRNREEPPNTYNIGYLFDERFRGQGYAAEACRAILDDAFTHGAVCFHSGTAADNHPSRRLLARLGFCVTGQGASSFREDEQGKPIEFTGLAYELTREDWTRKAERESHE